MQTGRRITTSIFLVALSFLSPPQADAETLGLRSGRTMSFDIAEVAIGKALFFSKFPSDTFGRSVSCALCHGDAPTQSGSSPSFLSHVSRSAPPLTNLSYKRGFGWEQVRQIDELIENALINEMQVSRVSTAVQQQLGCFGLQACTRPIVYHLKTYLMARKSHSSRFDRYFYSGEPTLSADEIQGLTLFSDKARCISCHKIGADFAEFTDHSIHNIGLRVQNNDRGRCIKQRNGTECNLFVTPSLRDVSLTSPYMHDGRFADLRSVVEFYDRGGDEGVQFVDSKIMALSLTKDEIAKIVAFLRSLEGKIGH